MAWADFIPPGAIFAKYLPLPARDQEKFLCDIIAQRSMFVRSTEWLFNYEMPFMGRIDKKSTHTFELFNPIPSSTS